MAEMFTWLTNSVLSDLLPRRKFRKLTVFTFGKFNVCWLLQRGVLRLAMKQQERTGAQWRPEQRRSGHISSVSGTIKIFKRLVQITCCHTAWLLRPATTVCHAENPYTQTLHADMTVPRGAKHDDPLQAVFHQAYYSFFHCLVMPCHCRATHFTLHSCRGFFPLSRRALPKRTLLLDRERGRKLWDAALSLWVRQSRNMKL